jgi:HEAT repeat protein
VKKASPPSARSTLLLTVLAIGFVVVPFLFWQGTWFGRRLKPDEISRFLHDYEHPRKIQHALSQVVEKLARGEPEAQRWHPDIVDLAQNPTPQVRMAVAWAMGHDDKSEAFHHSLLQLLMDPELMVRRNAALALVRFRDSAGRREIVRMLEPHVVKAPCAGALSVQLRPQQEIGTGTLLAKITADDGFTTEVRSPFPGKVNSVFARDGGKTSPGDSIVSLSPGEEQVWEALRALYLIGEPADLPSIEHYERLDDDTSDRIRKQAALTAGSIRARAEQLSTH